MTLTPGSKLGPYEITAAAGAGGMGEVYKAKDTRLDRTVAVKILPTHAAGNADLRQRFEREAKAISSLNHPHICTLYDIGQQDGTDYLVMEFLEGETLGQRLAQGPLAAAELLRFATQIADALDKAHRQGLIHRDLKPGNIMLTKEGAKLMDFGLARLVPASGIVEGVSGITRTTPLTGEGTILGTLQYMAPEQLEGKEADARSDIFAFGAVLYEMATGKRAFDGKSQASLIAAILREEPRSVSLISPMSPPMLDRVVKQCLEKDPDHRWQSAGDLKRALQWVSEGGSQVGIPLVVSKRRKTREWILSAVATCSLLAAGFFAWTYFVNSRTPQSAIRTTIDSPEAASFNLPSYSQFSISPDGQSIAFVAMDSGGQSLNLWIRPLNSYVAMKLPGTEGAFQPFWSPDNRYVAYFADKKLKKILASGGPSMLVADNAPVPRGGSWSKDDVILFTPNSEGVIYKVAAAGGKAEPYTVLDSVIGDNTHRWVSFLPNGRDFLFFARVGGGEGSPEDVICVGSLDSKEIKRLVKASSNVRYADGYILYTVDGVLMAQPFDPDKISVTGDAMPVVDKVTYLKPWSLGVFDISPAGLLAYRNQTASFGSDLVITDHAGGIVDTVGENQRQYNPAISPDGNQIAVDISNQQTTSTNIWVYDLNSGIRSRLTFSSDGDLAPVWSPDGSKIAYMHSGTDRREGIYVVSASGVDTGVFLCAGKPNMRVTDWTPDGKYLLAQVVGTKTDADIWVIPTDGTTSPYALIETQFAEAMAKISPDGRWVAYLSTESGKEEVYVTQFPKPQGKWQVSNNEGDRPHWSRDGKRIFYLDNTDHICEAVVDGSVPAFKVGQRKQLFEIRGSRPGFVYDVFGNGERFVINQSPFRAEVRSSLNLVQNWSAELKK